MKRAATAAALAGLPFMLSLPAAAGPDAASLAGVYKHLQPPSTENGVTSRDEDILEIVPYEGARDKAYFRLFIRFANYHSCDATGIARTTPTGLRYEAKVDGMACSLKMDFTPKGLAIQDHDDLCRTAFCGARGVLNWTSPIRRSDRRPIRYGKRILESDQYEKAVEIEKAAPVGKTPAP
uniref:hypothetical protein n=1 Tax=Methylobacterium sp. B34 TaxID=95563 RepID=UPI0005B2839C|nr:hypothetical protein [Methylobacterium sp. B34]